MFNYITTMIVKFILNGQYNYASAKKQGPLVREMKNCNQ